MEAKENGWVIINENHPNTNSKYLVPSTFANTRRKSIRLFIEGSNENWRYWYRKYNFRCVKAISLIKTL